MNTQSFIPDLCNFCVIYSRKSKNSRTRLVVKNTKKQPVPQYTRLNGLIFQYLETRGWFGKQPKGCTHTMFSTPVSIRRG